MLLFILILIYLFIGIVYTLYLLNSDIAFHAFVIRYSTSIITLAIIISAIIWPWTIYKRIK